MDARIRQFCWLYTDILKGNLQRIGAVLALEMLLASLQTAVPYITGILVDKVASLRSCWEIARPLSLLVVVFVSQVGLGYLVARMVVKLKNILCFNMDQFLVDRVKSAKETPLVKMGAAYLQQRIRSDVELIVNACFDHVAQLIVKTTMLCVIAVLIYSMSPRLLTIFAASVPLYLVIALYFKRRLFLCSSKSREAFHSFIGAFAKQLEMLRFIKVHALYQESREMARKGFDRHLRAQEDQVQISYAYHSSSFIVKIGVYIGLFWVAASEIMRRTMTLGNMTSAISYLERFFEIVDYVFALNQVSQDIRVSIGRIKEVLALPIEERGKQQLDGIQTIILKNVSPTNEQGRPLFQRIDATFERGKVYGICGQNGSGKSTLVSLILGLEDRYDGTIVFNSSDLRDVDMPYLRRHRISVVEQSPSLFFNDLPSILSAGRLPDMRQEEVLGRFSNNLVEREWLATLLDRESRGENSWDSALSGGERQKLAIARACAQQRDVVILDEPTSALDQGALARFVEVLNQIKRNRIVVIISHSADVLAHADGVIRLCEAVQ